MWQLLPPDAHKYVVLQRVLCVPPFLPRNQIMDLVIADIDHLHFAAITANCRFYRNKLHISIEMSLPSARIFVRNHES